MKQIFRFVQLFPDWLRIDGTGYTTPPGAEMQQNEGKEPASTFYRLLEKCQTSISRNCGKT